MKIARLVLVLWVTIAFFACAPTRIVKPLRKDEQVVGLSVGGPLIAYSDHTIPMPLSSLLYARGMTNTVTAFGGVHLTSLMFGVFQTDVGISQRLYYNDHLHLGIGYSPVLNIAVDKWERHLKVWPQLDINTYWTPGPDKTLVYVGVTNWFELAKYRADETSQSKHWFVNPYVGVSYSFRRWSFTAESKYLAPAVSTQPNVVEYKGINGHGALGIYVAANRTLK